MDNNTRNLLGLTDKNFVFEENWLKKEKIKGRERQIIKGKLVDTPKFCPQCGVINNGTIIKNGTYTTNSQLPSFNRYPTFLNLKRARFNCTECHANFSAKTPLIDDYCSISKPLKYQIAIDLKQNWLRKSIADLNGTSDTTVTRFLNKFTQQCTPNYHYLPKVISVDEFKSTRSCHFGMSFICVDGETNQILDILEDRRVFKLTNYFFKYSRKARLQVKFIVIDMNANYGALLKTVFPNAQIKRVAYGYRNFLNFKRRIFLQQGLAFIIK